MYFLYRIVHLCISENLVKSDFDDDDFLANNSYLKVVTLLKSAIQTKIVNLHKLWKVTDKEK